MGKNMGNLWEEFVEIIVGGEFIKVIYEEF
jgi:hypothetical protein